MKDRFKKYIAILTTISILFIQTVPVYAEDPSTNSGQSPIPTSSPAESVQTTSEQVPQLHPSDSAGQAVSLSPSSPQESPTSTPTPTSPPAQENTTNTSTSPDSVQTVAPERTGPLSDAEREARKQSAKAAWEQQFLIQHPELNKTNGSNGNTGSTTLKTGNATNSSAGVTSGNSNSSLLHQGSAGQAGQVVGNTSSVQGGAVSDNASTVTSGAALANAQTNSAKVGNNVNQSSITGKSSTSFNVGDSTLTTGNANVSGTAVTGVNTNLSNVQVSEFNVIDNQKGDLVLSPEAFAANCIAGCVGSSGANIGNPSASFGSVQDKGSGQAGAQSVNTANTTNALDTNTTQNNNAGVGNNLTLTANSGNNAGSFNTGGNTIINTGDANVSANSLTFANNNIAGGVTFGVVNIYGNLEGDIVLPEFASVGPSASTSNVAGANTANAGQVSGNPSASSGQGGALSNNTTGSDNTTNTNTFQNNDVTIANNVTVNGNTGNNGSNDNTSGNTTINTGKTTTDTNVLNIANSNVSNGTWWLVLVNHAGNWVGKLLGAPEGATTAGSAGTEFKTDANGQITASNPSAGSGQVSPTSSGQVSPTSSGQVANGAVSQNTTNVSSTTNTDTTQNNNADIQNNLNLSANTGGNRTDFNTGGHNTINTGDSNIIANLVNFVNNNISGNGKLAVTIVNVFGKWTGDFVTPGQQKQNKTASNQQTQSSNNTSSNTNNGNAIAQNSSTSGDSTSSNNQGNNVNDTDKIVSGFKTTPENAAQNFTENNNTETVKVAGLTTSHSQAHPVTVAGTNEKIIRINLAWAILFLPIIVAYVILKRINILLPLRKR